MATVSLKGIQKIYPNTENEKKKIKKKKKKINEEHEEKSNLKITEEGVVEEIAAKYPSVLVTLGQ